MILPLTQAASCMRRALTFTDSQAVSFTDSSVMATHIANVTHATSHVCMQWYTREDTHEDSQFLPGTYIARHTEKMSQWLSHA